MNLRNARYIFRSWSLLALMALLAGMAVAWSPEPTLVAAQPPEPPGLRAAREQGNNGPVIVVESPGRFALALDQSGVSSWYDLQRDPARSTQQVLLGTRLVEHRTPDGALLAAAPRLERSSRVNATLSWAGKAAGQPFSLRYTVWAGGQVAIELRSAAALSSTLQLNPAALGGAVLQPLSERDEAGQRVQTFMLYLDAWTADGAAPLPAFSVVDGQQPLDALNTVQAAAAGAGPLTLSPPPGLVRQPRFSVQGWPSAQFSLARGSTTLVEGVDYLAAYDPATRQLDLQYLYLLPQGEPAERSFTLNSGLDAAPVVALGLRRPDGSARGDVNENGMLVIDANLPASSGSSPGTMTSADTFRVPYIQKWNQLRLVATVSSPPATISGMRFTVSRIGGGFSQTVDDSDASNGYSADITLPAMAEYSARAEILVGGSPNGVSDQIAKAGYGRIFVSIGDSISAGKWGYYRPVDQPLSDPPAQGGSIPVSSDSRNYPQMDNTQPGNNANRSYAGYQVELNNRLTQCTNAPVFILNDGFSGIRTGRDITTGTPNSGTLNVLVKQAIYRKHLTDLGADYVLLQVGTNDASSNANDGANPSMSPTAYRDDLKRVVQALRQDNANLVSFVARLPWRGDGNTSVEITDRQKRIRNYNREIQRMIDSNFDGVPDNTLPLTFWGPEFYTYFNATNATEITQTNPEDASQDKLHPNALGMASMARLWANGDGVLSAYPSPVYTPPRFNGLCNYFNPNPATPTSMPTQTPTSMPTQTATNTALPATSTATNTNTATPSRTATASRTPTRTPTLRPGESTYTPTSTPTRTLTPTSTRAPTSTATAPPGSPTPTATKGVVEFRYNLYLPQLQQ